MNKLSDYIKELNANINNLANSEKAKTLRKQLIIAGIIMMIVGFCGAFICFISFALISANSMGSFTPGFPKGIFIPFFLIIPLSLIGSIGLFLLRAGLSILIGGETSKYLDKINKKCPKCGKNIEETELYCSQCGGSVRDVCECGNQNEPNDNFCRKCGKSIK